MAQCRRHVPEQAVAGGVAEAIVELLEAVQIQHHDCKAVLSPSVARQLIVGPEQERATVGDSGHRIAERKVTQYLTLTLQSLASADEHGGAGGPDEHQQRQRRTGARGRRGQRGCRRQGQHHRSAGQRADPGSAQGRRHQRGRDRQPDDVSATGERHDRRAECTDQPNPKRGRAGHRGRHRRLGASSVRPIGAGHRRECRRWPGRSCPPGPWILEAKRDLSARLASSIPRLGWALHKCCAVRPARECGAGSRRAGRRDEADRLLPC